MKNDEFAFFNQQLSAMLRDGVPLEGALRQLCAGMAHGQLRTELGLLGEDLKNGVPLKTALATRRLPEFYKQMVEVGVQSNDLPAVLLLVADYYKGVNATWTRLKGLMVYPLLVLIAAFALSCFFTIALSHLFNSNFTEMMGVRVPATFAATLWIPPVLTGLLLIATLVVVLVPAVNRRLRWRLPALRDAKLFQVASSMGLMLRTGGNLDDALGLVQHLERGTCAGRELGSWKERLSAGRGKFAEMAEPGRAFPPMFLWLVGNAGEDLAGGFQRAAEVYGARAAYRVELFLYAVLPFSILTLGVMIVCQVVPVVRIFTGWMGAME